jgi:hypothetical protein
VERRFGRSRPAARMSVAAALRPPSRDGSTIENARIRMFEGAPV